MKKSTNGVFSAGGPCLDFFFFFEIYMGLQVLEHKKLHAGWIMLLKVVSSSCSYFHIRLAFMGTSFAT